MRTNPDQLRELKLSDPIAFAASDEIFTMFAGILHRITERVENGLFDGIGREASSVKFEDVFDVIHKARNEEC